MAILGCAAMLACQTSRRPGSSSTRESSERFTPASFASLQRQLDAADESIGARSAERIVVWDASSGGSQAEHDDICEGALVLALAVAQSPSDLPLTRLHVAGPGGRDVDLMMVGEYPKETLAPLRISGKAGTNVWAGLYYLPAVRRIAKGSLQADFPSRKNMDLGAIPDSLFAAYMDRADGELTLFLGNVGRMALREYPGVILRPDFAKSAVTPEGPTTPGTPTP